MIDIISPNSYNDENANNQGSGVTENEARETIKKWIGWFIFELFFYANFWGCYPKMFKFTPLINLFLLPKNVASVLRMVNEET